MKLIIAHLPNDALLPSRSGGVEGGRSRGSGAGVGSPLCEISQWRRVPKRRIDRGPRRRTAAEDRKPGGWHEWE